MTDYRGLEQRLSEALRLERRPVAVTFQQNPPAGVARFQSIPRITVPNNGAMRLPKRPSSHQVLLPPIKGQG